MKKSDKLLYLVITMNKERCPEVSRNKFPNFSPFKELISRDFCRFFIRTCMVSGWIQINPLLYTPSYFHLKSSITCFQTVQTKIKLNCKYKTNCFHSLLSLSDDLTRELNCKQLF